MKDFGKIPDGELEIMVFAWEQPQGITSEDILEKRQGKKTLGRTTILKFLSRLVERGFLAVEKKGKYNMYYPLVAEKDYLETESKSFLEKLCHNSVKHLVASLYDSKTISKEDLEELKAFIEEAK